MLLTSIVIANYPYFRAMEPYVAAPDIAATHYRSLFYGKAKSGYVADKTISETDRYNDRLSYARALGQMGEHQYHCSIVPL